VKVVVLRSGKDACSAPAPTSACWRREPRHKVNFCKFTNETRNAIEDASETPARKHLRR
jgi:benzoyl-CoA-dihydrodiol lyase